MREDLYADLLRVEEFHWWHKAKQAIVLRFYKDVFQKKDKERTNLLDIGCGTGMVVKELEKVGCAWGVDSSQLAISFCKQRQIKNVLLGSAEALPYKDELFDGVCLLDVLEHVNDKRAAHEAYRVLKKGGWLVVMVPAYMFLWSEWDVVLNHKRRYNKKQLVELLVGGGFQVVKTSYLYSFLLVPVFIVRRLRGWFGRGVKYQSDFQINLPFSNLVFSFFSQLEQTLLKRYDMPFGTSILCVAQKK